MPSFIQKVRESPPIFELCGEASHRISHSSSTNVTYRKNVTIPYSS